MGRVNEFGIVPFSVNQFSFLLDKIIMQTESTPFEAAAGNLDEDQLITKIIVYLEEMERKYQNSIKMSTSLQES